MMEHQHPWKQTYPIASSVLALFGYDSWYKNLLGRPLIDHLAENNERNINEFDVYN